MYNKVTFWASNTPSNGSIQLSVLMNDNFQDRDEAIAMAKNILESWQQGLSDRVDSETQVTFDDFWAD